jgi:hemin uptake protein HemP
MSNRFYQESFNASLGSRATSGSLETQFRAIEAAAELIAAELDALRAVQIITGLEGFPASFTGAGLKELRVNAAESSVEFVSAGKVIIKTVAGTTYTLLATDAGARILFTNAAAVTVTVPPDVFDSGEVVMLCPSGTGTVTLAPGAGVTLNASDSLLTSRARHSWLAVVCDDEATNTFGVGGDRAPAGTTVSADIQMSVSDLTTAIATGTSKAYCRVPRAMVLTGVRASLLTASTSGAVTVDINVNGSTILSTKLTLDANEKTSVTAATAAVLTSTSLADDDEITIDIDGAGTGAKGLIVTLRGVLA